MTKKQDLNEKWQKFAEKQDQLEDDADATVDDTETFDDNLIADEGQPGIGLASREELETQLNALEAEVNKYKEQSIRAAAELKNVQARAERDVEKAHKYGNEKFISELLPVIDSLERATAAVSEPESGSTFESLIHGMQLTLDLFLKTLKKFGCEIIAPAKGDVFDPNLHEAMSMQEIPGAAPNTIVDVLQKGYQLNSRVLRAAMVIVAR